MAKKVREELDGFKETEIGLLPEDWKVVRLGDVAKIIMGQSPPSKTYNEEGIGFPFLQGKAEFGDIYPEPVKWCSEPLKIAPKEAILISVRAPVGDVNITRYECCIGRGLAAINNNDNTDGRYLFYRLRFSKAQLEENSSGTTFKSINKNVLQSFLIPIPPLSEQRQIAYVLSTIQQAIEATEMVITAVKELKKSLMRHLFTYGPVPADRVDRVSLKETEIGPVPEHWEVVRVKDHCEKPQYGYTTSAVAEPIGPKFLRITDIQDKGVNWLTVPFCKCSKTDFEKYKLQDGDIVFARIGATTGKSYLIKECPPSVFASYLIRVKTKPTVEPEFLYYFFNTPKYWNQINANKEGNLKKGINASVLSNLIFPLPPLPEQRQIARILSTVDKKIEVEEKRKTLLQALFKTMLHLLMTGRVRVKDLEVTEGENRL